MGSLESSEFDLFADTDLSAASGIDDLQLDGLELDGLDLDGLDLDGFDLGISDLEANLEPSQDLGGVQDLETLDDFQGLGGLDELDFGDFQTDDLGLGILEAEQNELETSSQVVSRGEASFEDLMMFEDSGPEMGLAELNSLADLFEGEVPDLSSTWQVEEEISDSTELSLNDLGLQADSRSDRTFSSDAMSDDALDDLFGSASLDDDTPTSLDFDFELSSDEDSLLGDSLVEDSSGLDELDILGLGALGLGALGLGISSLDPSGLQDLDDDTSSSFNDLGELFGGLDEVDLPFDPSLDAGRAPLEELEIEGFKFDDDDSFSGLFVDGDSEIVALPTAVSDLDEMDSLFGDVSYDLAGPNLSASDTAALNGSDFGGLEDSPTLLDLTDPDAESDIFLAMDEPLLLSSLESETEMQFDPNLNFGSIDDPDNDWTLPGTELENLMGSDLDLSSEFTDSLDTSDFDFGEGLVLDNSSSDGLDFDGLLDEDAPLEALNLELVETPELDLEMADSDISDSDIWGDLESSPSDSGGLNDLLGMAAIGVAGVGAIGVVNAMQNPPSTGSILVSDAVNSDDLWDDDLWADEPSEISSPVVSIEASIEVEVENLFESDDDLSELDLMDLDDIGSLDGDNSDVDFDLTNLAETGLDDMNLDDMNLDQADLGEMSLDQMDLGEMDLDQMDLGELSLNDEFASMSIDSSDDIWGEVDTDLGSDDFDDLDSLLGASDDGISSESIEFEEADDDFGADDGSFSDLDDLLSFDRSSSSGLDFAGIDNLAGAAVLGTGLVAGGAIAANVFGSQFDDDPEFDDLEKLLEDRDLGSSSAAIVPGVARQVSAARRPATARPSKGFGEQTMRVPVKHLDNLSNLVGELVVNRNSLEQDQERMRQSLDNLLYQVQQLSDVGQRMQDLYERSLLESSLLASRQSYRMASSSPRMIVEMEKTNDVEYDPLEMDRFTGFHSLSLAS